MPSGSKFLKTVCQIKEHSYKSEKTSSIQKFNIVLYNILRGQGCSHNISQITE